MWYAFFVLGGFWFWALLLIEFIAVSIFVQDEQPLGSFLSVLIFVALIHLFGDANFFVYLKDNPWDVIRLGILYCGLGFAWACCKFYYNAQRVANKIGQLKTTFAEDHKNITKDFVRNNGGEGYDSEKVWKWYMQYSLSSNDNHRLSFIHQGTKIVFWMAYWPISMFWTFFTDILKNAAEWCYETFLVKIFKTIHDKTIGKASKFDIDLPE